MPQQCHFGTQLLALSRKPLSTRTDYKNFQASSFKLKLSLVFYFQASFLQGKVPIVALPHDIYGQGV